GAFVSIPAASNASATTATLRLPAPNERNGRSYKAILTNGFECKTESTPDVLTVNPPLQLSTVENQGNCAGENVTFSVTASGGRPSYAYQWYKRAVPTDANPNPLPVAIPVLPENDINHANTRELRLTNLQQADNGTIYGVIVRDQNNCEVASLPAARLTVHPPTGAGWSRNQPLEVCPNTMRTLTAVFGGGVNSEWQEAGPAQDRWERVGEGNRGEENDADYVTVTSPPFPPQPPREISNNGWVRHALVLNTAGKDGFRYRIKLTDPNGVNCPDPSPPLILDVRPTVALSGLGDTRIVCAADNTTSFQITETIVRPERPANREHTLNYTYQWEKDGEDIDAPEGTANPLTLTPLSEDNNGNYTVRVTDHGTRVNCTTTSTPAVNLTVIPPPALQPLPPDSPHLADQVICSGADVAFTIPEQPQGILIQWMEARPITTDADGNIINNPPFNPVPFSDNPTATTTRLELRSVGDAKNGYRYKVRLTNPTATIPAAANCTSDSESATLTVYSPPPLLPVVYQPRPACNESRVTFRARLGPATPENPDGTPPTSPTYTCQWKVTTPSGIVTENIGTAADLPDLVLNVNASDNRNTYTLTVTDTRDNRNCRAASSAILVVSEPPVVGAQPQSRTVCSSELAVFTVAARGVSYHWEEAPPTGDFDVVGTAIPPETNPTANTRRLEIHPSHPADKNGYRYRVKLSSPFNCSIFSNIVTLTVNPSPVLAGTPPVANQSKCVGETAIFSVAASGGTIPYTYQWKQGGNIIAPNETNNAGTGTLSLVNLQRSSHHRKTYTVTVTDANACVVTS
ncbi:MAG: hypothetical protein CRN43_11495, partial [Candidatus Nephrothrix sp. EaCA]